MEKEIPQPQDDFVLGLNILKDVPINSDTKSIFEDVKLYLQKFVPEKENILSLHSSKKSLFEYSKNKQWTGNLKKYKLNSNGTFGAVQWDAADKLNSKNASSRKIWTTGISATGTNNFSTTLKTSSCSTNDISRSN